MFPHKEYHIYTTASSLQKRHVHLTIDELAEARYLAEHIHTDVSGEWNTIYRLPVGDNVYLSVGDVYTSPSLQTRGYEGWESCCDGDFEEELFFDTMIFHKCTVSDSRDREPNWDVDSICSWVNSEHRDQFDEQLEQYMKRTDRKL